MQPRAAVRACNPPRDRARSTFIGQSSAQSRLATSMITCTAAYRCGGCQHLHRHNTPKVRQSSGSSSTKTRSANSPCILAQVLLRIGILRSQRSATDLHPYGFLKEKFLWALVSAVGIFCLGAGVTVAHGVMALNSPVAAMHDLTMNLAGGVLPVGQGL